MYFYGIYRITMIFRISANILYRIMRECCVLDRPLSCLSCCNDFYYHLLSMFDHDKGSKNISIKKAVETIDEKLSGIILGGNRQLKYLFSKQKRYRYSKPEFAPLLPYLS